MTREEAIRQIENRWSIMDYGESEALGEALDMAIEALHREEAEEKGYCHRIRPSNVEVVVNTVKGRWVEERGDWYGGGAWVCSICGYGYSFGAYHEANEFRYCPNCGARMEANE